MAYPAGDTTTYKNYLCLYLQSVIDVIAEEKEYTKPYVGFIDLLQSEKNVSNAPVKVLINNDGKTQGSSETSIKTPNLLFTYFSKCANTIAFRLLV